MKTNQAAIAPRLTGNQGRTALKTVLNILEKWECSTAEKKALLGIEADSTFFKYQKDPSKAKVSRDTMERLSYLLNIHSALRILFSAKESVYGWVRQPNEHPFYQGRSAMDVMTQGRVVDLYEVMTRLNSQ
ncbi:MAG: MbcA/ParS/Xre antitoxin family protein [Motiliproteus sp.]|nr:MbcA/ParS/Xre antitoxin family protein [Motiliproteus sp.]MCW9053384.1 MbcA/ParS/Xre antitoxin family protein [Motiliproteus sp.]